MEKSFPVIIDTRKAIMIDDSIVMMLSQTDFVVSGANPKPLKL